jgi:DNA-binding transcriptional LysR family regulator
MRRLLPPTHLLSAFIATARHGGIARAAAELHLTPGAVSKRVSELEAWVSMPLFDRARKRLTLSRAGEDYLGSLMPLMEQLEAATLALMKSRDARGVLEVEFPATLAERWLFPHLKNFSDRHPEVELRFTRPAASATAAGHTGAHCVLRYGRGNGDDIRCDYVCGHELVVVAPPGAAAGAVLAAPGDVRGHMLIHHESNPRGWRKWLEHHGIDDVDAEEGPRLSLPSLIVGAVSSGVGLALLPHCLVREEALAGTVTLPFPAIPHDKGYYLCHPPEVSGNAAFLAFRRWVLDLAVRTHRFTTYATP